MNPIGTGDWMIIRIRWLISTVSSPINLSSYPLPFSLMLSRSIQTAVDTQRPVCSEGRRFKGRVMKRAGLPDCRSGIELWECPSNCHTLRRRKKHEVVVVVSIIRASCPGNNRWCLLSVGILDRDFLRGDEAGPGSHRNLKTDREFFCR